MLYSSSMIDIYMNKRIKGLKIILYPLIIVLPLIVLFILLVSLKTRILFTILTFIVLFIYSIIVTYNIIENIIKSKDLIKHISEVLNGTTRNISGNITNVSSIITLKRNIHIVEIEVKSDTIIHKAYFNIDLFELNIKVNDKVSLTLSNNFIKEYEVL